MAGSDVAVHRGARPIASEIFEEQQKIIDDLEVLRAGLASLASQFNAMLSKLDADTGVADTDYNATHAVTTTSYDAASDLTAGKLKDA